MKQRRCAAAWGRLALTLVLAAGGTAQETTHDTFVPIHGKAEDGTLKGVDAAGRVAIVRPEGAAATLDLGALRLIRLHKRHPTPIPRQGFVLLRSGLELPATAREGAERTIALTSPLFTGEVKMPLSRIQAIRFAKLEAPNDGGFAKYMAQPKDDQDLIYFKTESKVVQRSVTIEGFSGDSVRYLAGGKAQSRRISGLYGIVMSTASGFRADPLPRPRVVLGVRGGTRIRGRLEKMENDSWHVALEERVTLTVPGKLLEEVEVESDRLVFLSDLKPSKVEQVGAFRTKKPWLINRSPLGPGIQLGGSQPRKAENGLVLIPRTRLTYDIGGAFDYFEAVIAIDSRSTGPAHAVFRVRDGKRVLYESKPITLESAPESIRVPVAKVQALTIEADFGKNFDFGDHCVFAEARVVKQGT
ncbi:MAG: NPCBM/NEW2 domain-containing protein [Planctomycetes bacterium]|nr:NPCBM/NEW2 domain-containing protein [Planctomycetota bacterium]MCB9871452.1 NPCBM/NEW2 domain-containing protein [Planctomycetota bacterium]